MSMLIDEGIVEEYPDPIDPIVIDDSDCNEINVNTREITVHDNNKILGVVSDENVKKVNFRCDSILSSILDIRNCNIYINYQNANGELNSYLVNNAATVSGYTYFSWILSRHVTAVPGIVKYIVCVKKSDGTDVTNEWNTIPAEGIVLENNIEPVEEIEEQNIDVIEQILSRISKLEAFHANN